jgi:amidohydrolase
MMMRDGALDGVAAVIALHVDSTLPLGQIALREGPSSAAVDSFQAWITASGGHGAYPHQASDPLWMLGPVLMALHGVVARRIDPLKPAVLSLGQIHGGAASNVIPSEVFLEGTLRSRDPQVREQLLAEVDRALALVRAFDGDYRLEVTRGYPVGFNHPEVSAWLSGTVDDIVGAGAITRDRAGMGAEDFAYMTQQVPGAMFMLGAATADSVYRAHHTPIFDIDERALPVGAAILAETARRFLAGQLTLNS